MTRTTLQTNIYPVSNGGIFYLPNQLGFTAPASLHFLCFWNFPELVERQLYRIDPELVEVFCQ